MPNAASPSADPLLAALRALCDPRTWDAAAVAVRRYEYLSDLAARTDGKADRHRMRSARLRRANPNGDDGELLRHAEMSDRLAEEAAAEAARYRADAGIARGTVDELRRILGRVYEATPAEEWPAVPVNLSLADIADLEPAAVAEAFRPVTRRRQEMAPELRRPAPPPAGRRPTAKKLAATQAADALRSLSEADPHATPSWRDLHVEATRRSADDGELPAFGTWRRSAQKAGFKLTERSAPGGSVVNARDT